jgi:outer membrane protein insertion porin family
MTDVPALAAVAAAVAVLVIPSVALGDPDDAGSASFTIGAGMAPDDGFLAAATVANPNLFGTGRLLALDARISERRQLFTMRYGEPRLLDTNLHLDVEIYNGRASWPGFDRAAAGGVLRLSYPLGEHTRWFVSYRLEEVTVEMDRHPAAARVVEPEMDPALVLGGGLVSSVGTGLVYDTRDAPDLPTRGTTAGAWIERADPRLGSDVDLFRGRGWAEHHQPIGPFTLHLGAAVEAVASRDSRGVPLSERIQLDGSSALRGFRPGGLGPFDRQLGLALGGNLGWSAQAELEIPVVRTAGLSLIAFADAAGVADLEGRDGSGAGTSVGLGLLWRSPIGPLRFDFAMPLGGENRGELQFLFGVGIAF